MRDNYDSEDEHDYSPNELAALSTSRNAKYRQIVESNLDEDDTIEKWQQRNLDFAKRVLRTPPGGVIPDK